MTTTRVPNDLLPAEVQERLRELLNEKGTGQLIVDVLYGEVTKARITKAIEWRLSNGTKGRVERVR